MDIKQNGPISIKLIDDRAQEILNQIREHDLAITDLLHELRHMTLSVETQINRSLVEAVRFDDSGKEKCCTKHT